MNNIIEHGCEKCGGQIIKTFPKLAPDGGNTPPEANKCDVCGHTSEISRMCGFQCSPILNSLLHRILDDKELMLLRLDPENSIADFNHRLVAAGSQKLSIDITTKPPTAR